MKRPSNIAALVVMTLALIGCSALNPLHGSEDKWKSASDLWSDVPRMDGLSQSQLEPPIFIKLLMRTALNQVAGGGGHDTGDWIVFDSSKTTDDVKNFYTNERMAASGWEKSDKSTCVSGSQYGAPQVGMVCLFAKHAGDKDVGLMIIPAKAEKAGQINVWFIRVESPRESASDKPSAGSNKPPTDERSTNMSKGPAPYGIDQRPMPTGAKIAELLPAQVGPYTRTGLRLASSQNLTPEEIGDAIDGPVYADYRAGDATIFVELGITVSVKDARDSLDVAVGDAAAGVFPTDPRFGARGQEPSYLKVIDTGGAFFAWTRGNYYFSAAAKPNEAALDAFMQAFRY
ncbi:MAG TPA: hypothetical protein VFV34_09940 [Blastocatellia bacterium]|nr:hypothetical protein [Blastocatellia bacterium]